MFSYLACVVGMSAGLGPPAQDWAKAKLEASPRHGEWVQVNAGDRTVHTFLVYPETDAKAPIVVVIHEIFGLTDWVMNVADQLASAGYIALAPDLLSGTAPGGGRTKDFPDTGAAREAIGKLPLDQITKDLNAVADYGLKLPAANGKLAVAGFCWGGTQTFRFATHRAKLDAAFVFYGSGPSDQESISRIQAPVYGFYAENDERVNSTVAASAKAMKECGKKFEAVTYKGAGHGFMRAGEAPDASAANKKARDDAWERWKALLGPLK